MKLYVLLTINSLHLCGTRKNCLISRRNLLLYQFIRKTIKLAVVIIKAYQFYELHPEVSLTFV
jgi:hypothetical protein